MADNVTEDERGLPFSGASRVRAFQEREDPPRELVKRAADEGSSSDDEPAGGAETGPLDAEERRPEAVDDLAELEESAVTDTSLDAPAKTGFRGLLGGLGIRVKPSVSERRAREEAAALREAERVIRQATWTRAVSILVANPKGGVGKTPVSLGIGGMIASIRGGSTAIIEVSDDPGALTFRAEGSPSLGIGQLVRDLATVTSAGKLTGYTAPQTSFASVIGSIGRRRSLTGDDVRGIAELIDTYYEVRVMDSGNQPTSSAFTGAADVADVLVVPVLNAGDAVLEAMRLLDELREQGGHAKNLADNAIIIRLRDGRVEAEKVVQRIDRIIANANVGATFEVPYDAHIAERKQITLDKLAPATQTAFTTAAAGVVTALKNINN